MPNTIQKIALTGLTCLLPVIGYAQTCKTGSIPATTPATQFTDHGDGTVTDNKTGLMWKKCVEGQDLLTCSGSAASYNWKDALEQAQTVNGSGFAGYTDWRVPNIKELASIVEEQCYAPAINLAVFPNTDQYAWFWSASPYAYNGDLAWSVFFRNGYVSYYPKSNGYQVRLVRSGQ